MAKERKSPQQKKALSYARDCRNVYGENDKAARKAIPARKAGENRKVRRKAGQALAVIERIDTPLAEVVESSLAHDIDRVGGWRKAADLPLGAFVAQQKAFAARRVGSNIRVRAEVARQQADPAFDGLICISSATRFPPEE